MKELSRDEMPTNSKIKVEAFQHVEASTSSSGITPSSSSNHIKSYFIGMGFQPTLVDKVMKDHGEQDADSLLETLLAHKALEKSAEMEEAESPSELFTSDSEFEESVDDINVDSDKRSSLLAMNFSMEEVDFATKQLGENASLTEMIDLIIAGQISQTSGEKDLNGSVGILGRTKEIALEAMFGTMDTTFRLLGMGFTEQEISSAIENLGSDVPVSELAEKILASRNHYNCVKEEEEAKLLVLHQNLDTV